VDVTEALAQSRTDADFERIAQRHAERTIHRAWASGFIAGMDAARAIDAGEQVAPGVVAQVKAAVADLSIEASFS
jgi:hypothetical protein